MSGTPIAHLLHSSHAVRFEHSLWPSFHVRGAASSDEAIGSTTQLTRDLPRVFRDVESHLRSPVAGDSCEALLFLPPLIAACFEAQVLASNDAVLIASAAAAAATVASSVAAPVAVAASATPTAANNGLGDSSLVVEPTKRRRLVGDERVGNSSLLQAQHRVTVDSCFLLAGDLFRSGSNVNRHLLLHVFNVCEPYLAFVVSGDELVNRVASVVASNDPIAQSLSLDTLACLRPLIAARADVRHRVLACIASPDRSVRAAALRATERLAHCAARFGDEAAPVLVALVANGAVEADARAHAATILRHMHRCDARNIDSARAALERVLGDAAANDELRATVLVSLTVLAERTLVDVPQQLQRALDVALAPATGAPLCRVASRCARRLVARSLSFGPASEQLLVGLVAAARSSARPSVPLGVLRCALVGSPSSLWQAASLAGSAQLCDAALQQSTSLTSCANAASLLWHLARSDVVANDAVPLMCARAVARCALPTAGRRVVALVALLRIAASDASADQQALAVLVDVLARHVERALPLVRLLARAVAAAASTRPDAALQLCGGKILALVSATLRRATVCGAILDAFGTVLRRATVAISGAWQTELSRVVRSAAGDADAYALFNVVRVAARNGLYAVARDCASMLLPSAAALSHTTAPWLGAVEAVVAAEHDLFAAACAAEAATEAAERVASDAALGRALRLAQRRFEETLATVEQLAASATSHDFAFQRRWLALRARCCSLLGAVMACMAASDSPRAMGRMLACRFASQLAELAGEFDLVADAVRRAARHGVFGAIATDDADSLRWCGASIRLLAQLCAAASSDEAANRVRLSVVAVRMASDGDAAAPAASGELVAWPRAAPLRSQLQCARVLASLSSAGASTAPLMRGYFAATLGAAAVATPALFFASFR